MRPGVGPAVAFRQFAGLGLLVLCLGVAACSRAEPQAATAGKGEKRMDFTITSTAFRHGDVIPKKHTGDGADVSPPLAWSNAPAGTRAFALICDDPDAPVGTWVHWVLYDIPASTSRLPENVPADKTLAGNARHGVNDFRRYGYGGPAPPPGRPHRYFFRVYALDRETGLPPGATKKQVLKAVEGHVLAEAQLMGTYAR